MNTCCVCGSGWGEVRLWAGSYACRNHTWPLIVGSRAVSDRLRRVEVSYYQDKFRHPALLVWSSSSLVDVRDEASGLKIDGTRILVLLDDVVPDMFAVDGVLADVLLSMRGGGRDPE